MLTTVCAGFGDEGGDGGDGVVEVCLADKERSEDPVGDRAAGGRHAHTGRVVWLVELGRCGRVEQHDTTTPHQRSDDGNFGSLGVAV